MNNNIMETVMSALDAANLNFTTELKPACARFDSIDGSEPSYRETKLYVPVRMDDNSVIANRTFTKKYHPIQNRDAFKVIGDISNLAEIQFRNVGSWGNGAGVYAQIALGEDMVIGNNDDRVGRYLSIINSHDGSRAMSILITPYRFVCKNQLSKAIKQASKEDRSILRVPHTIGAEDKMFKLSHTIDVCNGILDQTEREYKQLAETKVTMEQVREAMARSMPVKHDSDGSVSYDWESKATSMIRRFENADDGRTEMMTGWNLYNAIQGTFQHDSRNTSTKMQSILCGSIARKSYESLHHVEDVAFNPASFAHTEHEEFDKLFRHVSVA